MARVLDLLEVVGRDFGRELLHQLETTLIELTMTDGVANLRLARPAKLNVLDEGGWRALAARPRAYQNGP